MGLAVVKPLIVMAVCLPALLSSAEAAFGAGQDQNFVWGKVTRIYDGDTIGIKDDRGQFVRVQLEYIDAPDMDAKSGETQPMHGRSQKTLSDLILQKEVIIESMGIDQFKRIRGVVFLDKLNVNLEMVRKGLAEVYHPVRLSPEKYNQYYVGQLLDAEQAAKEAKVGVWGDPGYVSPYKFRRRNN